ncbi:hypothetical protein E2P81_ATG07226 [Venturia nashicola]|nr:hypothetical protein E2P81_ATG07226 [Venturia nashicola]
MLGQEGINWKLHSSREDHGGWAARKTDFKHQNPQNEVLPHPQVVLELPFFIFRFQALRHDFLIRTLLPSRIVDLNPKQQHILLGCIAC